MRPWWVCLGVCVGLTAALVTSSPEPGNAAAVAGAPTPSRQTSGARAPAASAVPTVSVVRPAAQTVCVPDPQSLGNGGFESPAIGTGTFATRPQDQIPGWSTTASDGKIELWAAPFQGVEAAEGTQFAELNANVPGTLYQDVQTTPDSLLQWRLAHRGRNGTDTMAVLAGPPQGPFVRLATISDAKTWGLHSGTYAVPGGQTTTRFAFMAVSSAGGNPSFGNFLDDITFGSPPCLEATSSVRVIGPHIASAQVGDTLRYSVEVTNAGGATATHVVMQDLIPAGTSFVPGSMAQTSGSAIGPMTDAADGDGGTFDAVGGGITVNPGIVAGTRGVVDVHETITVEFSVLVRPAVAGLSITNAATGVFLADAASGSQGEFATTAVTLVDPAVDVAVSTDAAPVVVGAGAQSTITSVGTNTGTRPASDAVIRHQLPTGLTFVSSINGCAAVGHIVTCPVGTLEPGQTAQRAFVVQVAESPSSHTLVTAATIEVAEFDLAPMNNRDTAVVITALKEFADIQVSVLPDETTIAAGNPGGFTVLVVNGGAAAADVGVTAELTGPATISAVAPEAGQCVVTGADPNAPPGADCGLGDLAPGASVAVTVTTDTAAGATPGAQVVLAARGTTSSPEQDGANNVGAASVTVVPQADLVMAKRLDSGDPHALTASYTLTVLNAGPSVARVVVVTDDIPAGETVVSRPPGCAATGSGFECTVGDVGVGQSVSLEYAVSVNPAFDLRNVATAGSTTSDPDLDNNTAALDITRDVPIDLVLTRDPVTQVVKAGESATVTLTASNNGPIRATGVVVTWQSQFSAGIPSPPGAQDGVWEVGDLGVGQQATLTVPFEAPAVGVFRGSALIQGDQPEAKKSDNLALGRVEVVAPVPPAPPEPVPPEPVPPEPGPPGPVPPPDGSNGDPGASRGSGVGTGGRSGDHDRLAKSGAATGTAVWLALALVGVGLGLQGPRLTRGLRLTKEQRRSGRS